MLFKTVRREIFIPGVRKIQKKKIVLREIERDEDLKPQKETCSRLSRVITWVAVKV